MYNFDFEKFLKWLLPWEIRKPKLLSFFRSLLSAMEQTYLQFRANVKVNQDRVNITGQVRILRYELNRRFDQVQQRIEILDAEIGSVLFIYVEAENNPVYLPQFISGEGYDFLVRVPISLQDQEPFIKDFLNRFKLASKRYQIEYF